MYFYLYWHIAQMNGSSPERRHHSDSSSKFAHCRWYQREHKLQHIQSSSSIHVYALLQMAQFSSLSSVVFFFRFPFHFSFPFPFTLLIVCFRFLFSCTGAVKSVLVGELGSGVERGFMPIGPGCSASIGVSSSS